MASRLPIVVGILAIAGGIAWFALRRTSEPSGTTQGSESLTPSGSGKAAISAPEGPALTGSGSDSGSSGSAAGSTVNAFDPPPSDASTPPIDGVLARDVFMAQSRDEEWAPRTEQDLRNRLRKLGVGAVTALECRSDRCELTIAGSADVVDKTIAKLESGLTSVAKSLLLGRPEMGDGSLSLRVYAIYDR